MIKNKIHIFIQIATLAVCSACSTSWDDEYGSRDFEAMVSSSSSLTVDKSSLTFNGDASSQQLAIKCEGYWQAASTANWLQLGQTKGKGNATLSVKVSANNLTSQARQATITISNGLENQVVGVSQDGVPVPTFSNIAISNVTKNSAVCTFSFVSTILNVTEYGICYSSTAANPTTDNADVLQQSGGGKEGTASFTISSLNSKTTYHLRAYVFTSMGTTYSDVLDFTTQTSAPKEDDNGTPEV